MCVSLTVLLLEFDPMKDRWAGAVALLSDGCFGCRRLLSFALT